MIGGQSFEGPATTRDRRALIRVPLARPQPTSDRPGPAASGGVAGLGFSRETARGCLYMDGHFAGSAGGREEGATQQLLGAYG